MAHRWSDMFINSEFRPVKLRLKIDLVSYPARAEGLVNMNTFVKTFEIPLTFWNNLWSSSKLEILPFHFLNIWQYFK